MKNKNIIVLGATSAIAENYARLQAPRGARLVLAARNPDHLAAVAADLRARGAAEVMEQVLDLAAPEGGFASAFSALVRPLGTVDVVLIAYGVLGDQGAAERAPAEALRQFSVNMVSACAWAGCAAEQMQIQGHGTIAAISSVAGDRGRRSNYVYGAAKAGLSTFMAGLAHRFAGTNIKVITIKPGFVDTPMTAGIKKSGLLWATPARVARDIDRCMGSNRRTLYTPWFWHPIMAIIRNLPNAIFNRLNI